MAKHEFVAGAQVWPTLQRLSSRCSEPKFVASAYLGDGAGDLVQLAEGDVLVVALSETNAKNGSVSPREIRRLMDLGVDVFEDRNPRSCRSQRTQVDDESARYISVALKPQLASRLERFATHRQVRRWAPRSRRQNAPVPGVLGVLVTQTSAFRGVPDDVG